MATLATEKPTDPESMSRIADLKEWQKQEFGPEILKVLNNVR
jgi:hypothetical protein